MKGASQSRLENSIQHGTMHVTAAFGFAKELRFPMAVRFGLLIVSFISSFSTISVAGEIGIASRYCGLARTASGKKFSCQDLVAAHLTLPLGQRVRVRNLSNGKAVSVTIVDRGPFVKGRIIDLSAGAASRIGPADLMRVEIVPD
jgi:rare lipoprotein A